MSLSGAVELEVLDTECYLLRHALSMEEQINLFGFIQQKDRTDWANLPHCMNPTPKTLQFEQPAACNTDSDAKETKGTTGPTLNYTCHDSTLVNNLITNAMDILDRNDLLVGEYKSISLATIKYPSPDGRFAAHIDHCNDSSWVYLWSIGCAANFMVKGPNMDEKTVFSFNSGDLLVFNASSSAAILHEVALITLITRIITLVTRIITLITLIKVVSIGPQDTCPSALQELYQVLQQHRYGIQCRVRF